MSALLATTVKCSLSSHAPRSIAELHLTGPSPNIVIAATFEEERTYLNALYPVLADKVSRIEFINTRVRNSLSPTGEQVHRGAFVYDDTNFPLMHLKGVVLGYAGTGQLLLKRMCELLRLENGTYERITRMAQENTAHYAVTVTLLR